VDETLTESIIRRLREPSGFEHGGKLHSPDCGTGIFDSHKKLAMWLFIIADTMTFAACLVAYGFVRNGSLDWPRPFHSITNVALMTFILLTSSLTCVRTALRAGRRQAAAFRWTMISAALGIVLLCCIFANGWRLSTRA